MTIAAKDKSTKAEANYRMGTVRKHCGICTMFKKATASCTAVRGLIDRDHVCDYFEAKK